MKITGPLDAVQINDNPDNYNIQKEMDAINEPIPGWVKIVRAKPGDKLQLALAQARKDPEYELEGHRIKIEELQRRITTLEKRWGALRKTLMEAAKGKTLVSGCFYGSGMTAHAVLDKMTEITRKIK